MQLNQDQRNTEDPNRTTRRGFKSKIDVSDGHQ